MSLSHVYVEATEQLIICREVSFGSNIDQIDFKWDKIRTISDQLSGILAENNTKKSQIRPIG